MAGNITYIGDDFIELYVPKWSNNLRFFFMLLVASIGVPGNGLVILVQIKTSGKSSTDWLVLTRAVSDLICAGFVTNVYILRCYRHVWTAITSDILCKCHYYVIYSTTVCSTMLLTAVALDRYANTCKPHMHCFTVSRSKLVCIFIAVASCACCVPCFDMYSINKAYTVCEAEDGVAWDVSTILFGIGSFVMFFVVAISYSKIAYELRLWHNRKILNVIGRGGTQRETQTITKGRNTKVRHSKSLSFKSCCYSCRQKKSRKIGLAPSNTIGYQRRFSNIQPDKPVVKSVQRIVQQTTEIPFMIVMQHTFEQAKGTALRPRTPTVNNSAVNYNIFLTENNDLMKVQNMQVDISGTSEQNINTSAKCSLSGDGTYTKMTDPDLLNNAPTTGQNHQGIKNNTSDQNTQQTRVPSRLLRDTQRINRTTKIMFMITVVFVLSMIINWLMSLYKSITKGDIGSQGRIVLYLLHTSFMINCAINPIFYMCLSSLFRKKVKNLCTYK